MRTQGDAELMATDLIPFGKYKGQPLEVIASDRGYCDWLLAQAWFVERYPQIHTLVINNFGEPSETPEHNALQIRLLDEAFRAQCTEVALRFFAPDRDWTHTIHTVDGSPTMMDLATPYFVPPSVPDFEHAGIDVTWTVQRWGLHHACGHDWPARLPDTHETWWYHPSEESYTARRIAVECKPLIGDDYPAILRFLKNLPSRLFQNAWLIILAGAVQSRTVSWPRSNNFLRSPIFCSCSWTRWRRPSFLPRRSASPRMPSQRRMPPICSRARGRCGVRHV